MKNLVLFFLLLLLLFTSEVSQFVNSQRKRKGSEVRRVNSVTERVKAKLT